jgi:putative membrane protein
MKTTIFSSFALWAIVSVIACQSPSNNNNNATGDSTGSIRQEPSNTETNTSKDTSSMATRSDQGTNTTKGTKGTVDEKTSKFMNEAAMGGNAEVQFGKLAEQNASSQRVKNFGEMMVKDHSAANDDLKSVAKNKNVTLPTDLGKHQHHYDDLSKKQGADFDKAYMKMMVDDHKEDIDAFEKAANTSTDPDVKNFATQKLPILRKHLDSAKAIEQSLSMSKKH